MWATLYVGYYAQNYVNILSSIMNIIEGTLYDHLMFTNIFISDNELDIYTSSKFYEANGYKHDLETTIILY